MTKYYTRACNFYYGVNAKLLIKKKLALPLCGNKNIAFDKIEIITRYNNKVVSKIISIKKIKTLSYVASNELKIDRNKLLKLDTLIIEKIILISLKFFSDQNFKVRSAKIAILISEIKKSNFNNFILKGIIIVKKDKFLSFSKK